ncbi:hypothetical protein MJO28_006286 [Puccinia striiformis f. sp. tritici]|uniref:Uncharacterized protein n=1 Tax=Puccinia striiformis f. sp. tritici TaxID=168172 RepID=A0ACC0EI04_9BASI|nr:hypothetical protein MJO28_006286 [Puccinia striiformis f. sp. tritici]
MALTIAQIAQRKRRSEETGNSAPRPAKPSKKVKPSTKLVLTPTPTILIPSDDEVTDDDGIQLMGVQETNDAEDKIEIMDFQEREIEEQDLANNIVQLIQASLDDGTSDEDELSGSDLDGEEETFESLWPVFTMAHPLKSPSTSARKLRSGKIGYRKPVENPSSSSSKFIPAPTPRQTDHHRRKEKIKALGKNNPMSIENYFIREKKPDKPAVNHNRQDLESPRNLTGTNQTSVELRLSHYSALYHSGPNRQPMMINIQEQALARWNKLNHAINFVMAEYKKKLKKNPQFKYDSATIANLNEYNELWREFTIKRIKALSNAAAVATAQSAIRRLKQAKYIVHNKAILENKACNHTNHRSHLDNLDLRRALVKWAASQTPGEVNPVSFQKYVCETLLPEFGISDRINRKTVTRWMYKIGFTPTEYRKSLYFDGHERPDVVEARKRYIADYTKYRQRSRMYDNDTFETSAAVHPEVLGSNKETVFIFHDESTVHAKEKSKLAWLLPGTSEIRSKNVGRLIHISDFILETTGRLKLSDEQFQEAQMGAQKDLTSADAATVIYPGSTGGKWWDMEQLCNQISQKAIPIFNALHPNLQAVFVFDCSSAHGAFSPSALNNMNLSPGGKQSRLRDSIIPSDDPAIPVHLRGQHQIFCYDSLHPNPDLAGKPKGVQAILEERGLWQHYSQKAHEAGKPKIRLQCPDCATSNSKKDAIARSARLIRQAEGIGYFLPQDQCVQEEMAATQTPNLSNVVSETTTNNSCCWSKILSLQSDFANERPLLQEIIEDAGHICLFLPKFHCELNPIELFWSLSETEPSVQDLQGSQRTF